MSVRVVAVVWSVAAAILAVNAGTGPTFPFDDPLWWQAGWIVAAAGHLAVGLGARCLSQAMIVAAAPVLVRALALVWLIVLDGPGFSGVSAWIPVAYLVAWGVAIVWIYGAAGIVRRVGEVERGA